MLLIVDYLVLKASVADNNGNQSLFATGTKMLFDLDRDIGVNDAVDSLEKRLLQGNETDWYAREE